MGWLCWEAHMGADSRALECGTAGQGVGTAGLGGRAQLDGRRGRAQLDGQGAGAGHSAPPGGGSRQSRSAAHPAGPSGTGILWNETGTAGAVDRALNRLWHFRKCWHSLQGKTHSIRNNLCKLTMSFSAHAFPSKRRTTSVDGRAGFALKQKDKHTEPSTYPCRLKMLPELIHRCVWDAHIPEHSFQFRCELTSTFGLKTHKNHLWYQHYENKASAR